MGHYGNVGLAVKGPQCTLCLNGYQHGAGLIHSLICYRISSVHASKFEINRLGREDGLIKSTIF